MTQTQTEFRAQKQGAQDVLANLQEFLNKGDELGVETAQSQEKLEKAREKLNQSKLKVVFTGGYSEGKTAIASAWLGIELAGINSAESSDEIIVYDKVPHNDDVAIVDTPGLFGFKEKNGEKYKDKTKKFISEADIVLWVMNPENPIKESHGEYLNFLLRELNLLARTIFVISKFDDVADIEDTQDFAQNFAIKRANVEQSLCEMLNLSSDERANLSIVAVSANPYGRGLNAHWFKGENKELYAQISHISELQNATTQSIKQNGGLNAIVAQAQSAIIQDVIKKQLPVAKEMNEKIKKDALRLKDSEESLLKDMGDANEKISNARKQLRSFVTDYFNDLINQARHTSLQSFDEFMQSQIGSSGSIINTKVQNSFETQTDDIANALLNNIQRFNAERSDFEQALTKYGKSGLALLKSSGVINANNVKLGRDLLEGGLKMVGVNVGNALKFKPWGAVNFASKVNAAVAVLGVALELWDSWKNHEKEQEFKKARDKIVEMLEAQLQELLGLINKDEKFFALFPHYDYLKHNLENTQKDLQFLENREHDFNAWVEQGEKIESKFKALEYKG